MSNLPTLKELLEAGAHFGHSTKRRNPKMDEYVYAIKNGVQVFDLVKTHAQLEKATKYLSQAVSEGKQVLVLGTKGQAAETVRVECERIGVAYVVTRWVGGLFTNWPEIKKRINKLIEMKQKMEEGGYSKYTKKEQVLFKREIERLERMYGGLVTLKKVPDIIVMIDPTRETTALRESLSLGTEIVAVCDSNCDPEGIKIVIPANDDALTAVQILTKALTDAIEEGIVTGKEKKPAVVKKPTKASK